jgi:hypothetical protein
MGKKLSDAEIGRFDQQLFKLRDMVIDGVRPFEDTRQVLQSLIERPAPVIAHAAWVSIISQMGQLQNAVAGMDDIPAEWFDPLSLPVFRPHSETAKPLVVLTLPDTDIESKTQRTFRFYIELIRERMLGNGSRFYFPMDGLADNIRLAPWIGHAPGLKLVSFDPMDRHEDVKAKTVHDLWLARTVNLAGPEVLAALALTDCVKDMPRMNLPSYQVWSNGCWSSTAMYTHWIAKANKLQLRIISAHACGHTDDWTSPTVVEC